VTTGAARFRPWDEAWQQALYGRHGFYARASGAPAQHFRTGVHAASPLLAGALVALARSCHLRRVVDVGSGSGELLNAMADVDGDLDLVGVDVRARPSALAPSVTWVRTRGGPTLPDVPLADALVVAHEWLDDVPCPVVEVAGDGGWRQVLVTRDGEERLGDPAPPDQQAWLDEWWASGGPGSRAEVGLPRDDVWAQLVASAPNSVLVAVDYGHDAASRPRSGTLVGYRDGRAVLPVPDGTCDVTAHVALDSVGRAGEAAGAVATLRTTQRSALASLGVTVERPDPSSARTDPAAYLASLQRCGEAAELLDPAGLGSFGWLLQSRGPALPEVGLDSARAGSPG
jgi:hypothetical protein